MAQDHVYHVMAEKRMKMSKAHSKIADYIMDHPNTVPFFTVSKLAKEAGVSEATVVRFAVFLGYSGFPDFQQHLQNAVQQQLTTIERLKLSKEVYKKEDEAAYDIFQDDIANIKATMESLDIRSLKDAADHLIESDHVYICANRSAAALGNFLHYYLNFLLDHAEMATSKELLPEQLYQLSEKDTVVGISFARYTKSTIDMVSFAKKQGSKTIVITDSPYSPLVPQADVVLLASSHLPTFFDSFVGPLSLINSLIALIGREKMNDAQGRLNKLEDVWEQFDVFYKKEDH
ncbi:MurR/RpiR family transcriptional regulator [Fictibacillus enclensis]|uniref:MurR/RpiR family transcriptional regulator n=1 Tax=Fictibacillus enclensis TaxID=1017270 RepID=UPI0024C00A1D|nr:MurR/RpiR family transcriptional regulator [Fictibacillus enclensis]WHY73679.1 MurR/RpiR family transcriptional regulator [Fictibacillus enclensis]